MVLFELSRNVVAELKMDSGVVKTSEERLNELVSLTDGVQQLLGVNAMEQKTVRYTRVPIITEM